MNDRKQEWRKRVSGTSRQIGQAFPIVPSMQKLRTQLPAVSSSDIKKRLFSKRLAKEDEEKQNRHDKATFDTEWDEDEDEETWKDSNGVPVNIDALRVFLEQSDDIDMTKKDIGDMISLFKQSVFPKTEKGLHTFLEAYQQTEDDVSQ
jgi:hypothetical protein